MTANLDSFSNLGSASQIFPVAPANTIAITQPAGLETDKKIGDFAELLTGYMLKTERQGLTASATGSTELGAGLQMLPLGRELQVITSDTPMPDLASVAAFARAQGLGDAAVQALFGPPEPSIGSALTKGSRRGSDSGANSDKDIAAGDVLAQISTAAHLQSNWSSPANASADLSGAQGLSNPAPTALKTEDAQSPNSNRPQNVLAQINTAAYLQSSWSTPASALQSSWSSPASTLAEVFDPLAAPTSLTMALGTDDTQAPVAPGLMMANSDFSKRLSQLTATDKSADWSSQMVKASAANNRAPQMTTLEDLQLELPALWSVDEQGGLIVDTPTPAAGATPGSQAGSLPGTMSEPDSPSLLTQAEQRNAQYQQLADRLGQALSQRLLSQIERGEWKMQMRMKPEGLGQIEVTLDMNAAGLNATFSADNNVTRELIAQGASRLKTSMAEAGVEVANLWVSGGANRQSGGNPTPGQAFRETPKTQNKTIDAPELSTTQMRSAAGPSDVTGLDVLA